MSRAFFFTGDFMDGNRIVSILLFLAALGLAGVAFWGFQGEPAPDGKLGEPVSIEPGALLLFTQEGCPPCRQLESALHSGKVSAFLEQSGVRITEVNTRRHQDLVRKFHIESTPTLVLLDDKAAERARHKGALDGRAFMEWVRSNR